MVDLDVRIEKLRPMRIAVARASGQTPESDAWQKLASWAEPRGFLDDVGVHPVFGFNNPPPTPDNPQHGYEFWIRVPENMESTGEIDIEDFGGGHYAVITHNGIPDPDIWMSLWEWVQQSKYEWRETHELERPHDPLAPVDEMTFDLYLPISAPKS